MGILTKIVNRNESPILFIGSGISHRYVENFPNWERLLIHLWGKTGGNEDDFYRKMIEIIDDSSYRNATEPVRKYYANIKMASLIQKKFNDSFKNGNIIIDGFTAKDAYLNQISPFKKEIANYFGNLNLKEGIEREIISFKKLLLSARAIITTNYDTLIEGLVGDDFKVFRHQTELFLSQMDCGEIYKIHGCVTNPNDIVITSDDYHRFERNSVLITAKLISFFMESPIIFIGYSLTDQNISSILKSFADSLQPEQRSILQERIIYVSHKPGLETIEEHQIESEALSGAHFTVVETDNYESLYEHIAKIDQGLPVAYVRKFKEHIRKLIVARGKEGSLKSLLITPEDLQNKDINDKNLVVAIGDNTIIFNIPDRLDYLKDYMKDKPEMPHAIILKFIASMSKNTRAPIHKHIDSFRLDESGLRTDEISRVQQRIQQSKSIESCLKSITPNCRKQYSTLQKIIDLQELKYKEIDIVTFNSDHLPLKEVEAYIKTTLENITYGQWFKIMTNLSRLIVVWDFYANRKTK